MVRTRTTALLLLGLMLGCSSPDPGVDAAGVDAASVDAASRVDASESGDDAGVDAHVGVDAAEPQDAGVDAASEIDAALPPPTWHVETVARTGAPDFSVSLAVAGGSRAIGWFDAADDRGHVAHRSASGWSSEIVEDADFTGYAMNVALDTSGRTRVVYHRALGYDLVYGTRDDAGDWTLTPVRPARALGWLVRAMLVDDVFHTVSMTSDAPQGVAYVVGSGTTWTEELAYEHVGSPAGGTGPQGIAVHEGRVLALLIHEPSGSTSDALLAVRALDGTWTNELVHSGVMAATGMTGLAVDAAGEPHFCFDSWDDQLIYVERVAGEWRSETIDAAPRDYHCAIAADSAGRVHLAYNGGMGVHYLVRDAEAWSPAVRVDDTPGAGLPIDLRLDESELPHLAYAIWSPGESTLRYAWLGL